MRIKTSYAVAALLALALIGWLGSGQLDQDGRSPPVPESVATAGQPPPMAVRVQELVAETIEREVTANGKTEPARVVRIRAEASGRVVEIGPDEGARVQTGDLLVKLDPRDRQVAVLEASAYLDQRRIELDAASKLGEKGFQASTKIAAAKANYAAAEAALKRAELDLDHTEIRAPFAGILDRRAVEVGDYLDVGEPVGTILDTDPLLVVGEVIETEVGDLRPGMPGLARLATGEVVRGKLRYVASRADEETRTFAIELEVANPAGRLHAGVSAELSIAAERLLAHRAPPSALVLNDEGVLGVKTVDQNDLVVFRPVDIVRADDDAVWLTGLPSEILLITVGQGFVREGNPVRPVPVTDGAAGAVVSEAVR